MAAQDFTTKHTKDTKKRGAQLRRDRALVFVRRGLAPALVFLVCLVVNLFLEPNRAVRPNRKDTPHPTLLHRGGP